MVLRRLAALLPGVLFVAAPAAFAQADARPAVFVSAGTFSPDGHYSDELAVVAGARTVTVGAEVPVVRRSALTGMLGAALRFADVDIFFAFEGETTDEPVSESGFRPQHLDLYGRLTGGGLSAVAGFVLDLGPNPRDDAEDREVGEELVFFNSDAQHAVRLGVGAERPAGPVLLSAALDAFLTFPDRYTSEVPYTNPDDPGPTDSTLVISGTFDFGDTFAARAGAGYPVGAFEVGLDVLYALTTGLRSEIDGLPAQTGESRWLLSLAPRVTFAPAGAPVEVEVAMRAPGGWDGEHILYGVTVAGENQPEVRLPVSVGLRVAL